jgi:hypothetical protein
MEIRFRKTGEIMPLYTFRTTICASDMTPELLERYEADPVFEGPQAVCTPPYEFSYRNGVELIDGKWFSKFSVGPVFTDQPATDTMPAKTAEEQMVEYKARKDEDQGRNVRASRNQLLSACDWTQLADSPVDKTAWANYRQALRDVSSQSGFPWTVQWPSVPQ